MKKFLTMYFSCFGLFLIVDIVWIGYIAGPFYQDKLATIISDDVRIIPAFVFYALFVLGMVTLVVFPSLDRSVTVLISRAALFGLVCYATYDLTNYSTINDWPLSVVILDMAWGTGISSLVSYFGYWLANSVWS